MENNEKEQIATAVEEKTHIIIKVPLASILVRKLKAIGTLFENELDNKDAKKESCLLAKGIEKSCDSFDLASYFSKK